MLLSSRFSYLLVLINNCVVDFVCAHVANFEFIAIINFLKNYFGCQSLSLPILGHNFFPTSAMKEMKVKKRSRKPAVAAAAFRDGPRSKRLKQATDATGGEGPSANGKRLYVVIEDCSLEVAKVGAEHVVLCSDKHANWLRKQNRDPAQYRPDILHQCLLMLQDCPLNRAGLLRVFFHTKQNVLVNVNAQCRLPRTFDRFCGLMVQLLHKLQIRAEETSQKLLSVVKNPVTDHLPVGCRKLLTSLNCPHLVTNMAELVPPETDEPIVLVVGGISHGKIKTDYTEGEIKISNYPLSAALCCAKLTSAFEQLWGIL